MLIGPERPATILMTTDAVGGIWTYALDLARALVFDGVRTVLASLGPPPFEAQIRAASAIPGLTLEIGRYRLEWMDPSADEIARAGEWLLALEQMHSADLIHLNAFAYGSLPFRAPVVVVAHSCIGTWWRAVHGGAPPERYRCYLERVRQGLEMAEAVVAPTRAYLAELDRLHGPLPHAVVVPNGRDPSCFHTGRKRDMVFSAGRVWDAGKNVIALDAVAADLEWPVVVAGDWRPPDGAAAPPENLLCLDLVEPKRLRRWYAEAAIFALPARYEPFGLAALEAALSGCALVLGDLATQREVWGDAACYVPPDDPETLRTTLRELISDSSLRRRMADRAIERARSFTAERMAARYLELYRRLCARAPSADERHAAGAVVLG